MGSGWWDTIWNEPRHFLLPVIVERPRALNSFAVSDSDWWMIRAKSCMRGCMESRIEGSKEDAVVAAVLGVRVN